MKIAIKLFFYQTCKHSLNFYNHREFEFNFYKNLDTNISLHLIRVIYRFISTVLTLLLSLKTIFKGSFNKLAYNIIYTKFYFELHFLTMCNRLRFNFGFYLSNHPL